MNLYLLSQDINCGADTYDLCVVCAASEDEARLIHPQERYAVGYDRRWSTYNWADRPDQVQVSLIGVAVTGKIAGVICVSYNAGQS